MDNFKSRLLARVIVTGGTFVTLVSVVGREPIADPSWETVRARPSARLASALISDVLRSRSTSEVARCCNVAWVARCRESSADCTGGTDSDITIPDSTISDGPDTTRLTSSPDPPARALHQCLTRETLAP